MPVKFGIKIDDKKFMKKIDKMGKHTKDLKKPMKSISMRMWKSSMKNFNTERNPAGRAWKKLSQATIDARRKGKRKGRSAKILQDFGTLKGSIKFFSTRNKAWIGTNIKYASKHQYGEGVAMRKFMGITADNARQYKSILWRYINLG